MTPEQQTVTSPCLVFVLGDHKSEEGSYIWNAVLNSPEALLFSNNKFLIFACLLDSFHIFFGGEGGHIFLKSKHMGKFHVLWHINDSSSTEMMVN